MRFFVIAVCLMFGWTSGHCLASQADTDQQPSADLKKDENSIRFASFNISFNRKNEGQLKQELALNKSIKPKRIAEIIQRVRPDVIFLCEFDFDPGGEGIANFASNYLVFHKTGRPPSSSSTSISIR